MHLRMHPIQKAFFNGKYLGDVVTPTEPKKPTVLIVGELGTDLICTYGDQVITLTTNDLQKQKFKDVADIKKYAEKMFSILMHTPIHKTDRYPNKPKKPIGGSPTTLKARKKLLAQKMKNR